MAYFLCKTISYTCTIMAPFSYIMLHQVHQAAGPCTAITDNLQA